MRILLLIFTVLVLILPDGTLNTIALIGVFVTGAIALWQTFRRPRRRKRQPRQVQVTQRPSVSARPRPPAALPATPRRSQPARMQSRARMHEVIFIGERFYRDSHTEMGTMYEIDSRGNWDRFQIGQIENAVEHGDIVGVRKATPQEMAQAEQMLASVLHTQELRRRDW